jgi:hypothetical protein
VADFDGKTIMCHDNHFSGKEMVAYVVEHGWGTIGTLWWDCFLKGVPTKYFHKEWTNLGLHPKACSFCSPLLLLRRSTVEMALQCE